MHETLKELSVWIHLLTMVGAFGTLLVSLLGWSAEQKKDPDLNRRTNRFASQLIAVGFLAGLAAYFFTIKVSVATDIDLPSSLHMTVGIKFLLLLGVGACLGISSGMIRKERLSTAAGQRGLAAGLLAIAALLGVWI